MTTSVKYALVLAAAVMAAACSGGSAPQKRVPPQPPSHVKCFAASELPRVERAKISCFNASGCIATLITSMSTPPGSTGYAGRPSLTSASRFLNVHSNGFQNIVVPYGLNHDIDLTLLPGFDTPTSLQRVLVESIIGNQPSTLLDVSVVANRNLCP